MSNLSRLRHRSSRSARQAAYNIRDNNGAETTKVQKIVKTFLEYSLIDADLLVMMDTEYIFKELLYGSSKTIKLELFGNKLFNCEKIALIYSKRKKMFMYLGLNDNYTGFVLYKEKDVYKLPNIFKLESFGKFDNPVFHINENSNRLMCSLLDKLPDLTSNPIMVYKTNELFSK